MAEVSGVPSLPEKLEPIRPPEKAGDLIKRIKKVLQNTDLTYKTISELQTSFLRTQHSWETQASSSKWQKFLLTIFTWWHKRTIQKLTTTYDRFSAEIRLTHLFLQNTGYTSLAQAFQQESENLERLHPEAVQSFQTKWSLKALGNRMELISKTKNSSVAQLQKATERAEKMLKEVAKTEEAAAAVQQFLSRKSKQVEDITSWEPKSYAEFQEGPPPIDTGLEKLTNDVSDLLRNKIKTMMASLPGGRVSVEQLSLENMPPKKLAELHNQLQSALDELASLESEVRSFTDPVRAPIAKTLLSSLGPIKADSLSSLPKAIHNKVLSTRQQLEKSLKEVNDALQLRKTLEPLQRDLTEKAEALLKKATEVGYKDIALLRTVQQSIPEVSRMAELKELAAKFERYDKSVSSQEMVFNQAVNELRITASILQKQQLGELANEAQEEINQLKEKKADEIPALVDLWKPDTIKHSLDRLAESKANALKELDLKKTQAETLRNDVKESKTAVATIDAYLAEIAEKTNETNSWKPKTYADLKHEFDIHLASGTTNDVSAKLQKTIEEEIRKEAEKEADKGITIQLDFEGKTPQELVYFQENMKETLMRFHALRGGLRQRQRTARGAPLESNIATELLRSLEKITLNSSTMLEEIAKKEVDVKMALGELVKNKEAIAQQHKDLTSLLLQDKDELKSLQNLGLTSDPSFNDQIQKLSASVQALQACRFSSKEALRDTSIRLENARKIHEEYIRLHLADRYWEKVTKEITLPPFSTTMVHAKLSAQARALQEEWNVVGQENAAIQQRCETHQLSAADFSAHLQKLSALKQATDPLLRKNRLIQAVDSRIAQFKAQNPHSPAAISLAENSYTKLITAIVKSSGDEESGAALYQQIVAIGIEVKDRIERYHSILSLADGLFSRVRDLLPIAKTAEYETKTLENQPTLVTDVIKKLSSMKQPRLNQTKALEENLQRIHQSVEIERSLINEKLNKKKGRIHKDLRTLKDLMPASKKITIPQQLGDSLEATEKYIATLSTLYADTFEACREVIKHNIQEFMRAHRGDKEWVDKQMDQPGRTEEKKAQFRTLSSSLLHNLEYAQQKLTQAENATSADTLFISNLFIRDTEAILTIERLRREEP